MSETASVETSEEEALENARMRLREAKGFIFDMDGVLYRGGELLPGVVDVFNALELRQRAFILATNNSMSTPAEYVRKLSDFGVTVPESIILTAGTATRDYLLHHLPPTARILTIGMPALREQLFSGTDFVPVERAEDEPDAVVAALDMQFTYDKLRTAAAAIRNGAQFIATNADATLPTETGLIPGAGSIIAALAVATGRQPTVIGKPSPRVLEQAVQNLGLTPDQAVMIGDRLDTDILAGHRAGLLTVLTLTGVSTREEIPSAPALPDLVFTDLRAMLETLVGNES